MGYADGNKQTNFGKLEKLVSESSCAALLDSGCSKTVCGEYWYDNYVGSISDYDQSCVKEEPSKASFTFGDGSSEKSLKRTQIPCYIGGKRCFIETDVVKCNIPLLLSKKAMKKGRMCLNFADDRATLGKLTIPLKCSTSGHYLLPLDM